jgi:hypothetical protein
MVLDALTKGGIQFLWPIKIRVGIPGGIRLVLVLYLAYSDIKGSYKKIIYIGGWNDDKDLLLIQMEDGMYLGEIIIYKLLGNIKLKRYKKI